MESIETDIFYSIVCPSSIRPYSNYHVAVSILNNMEPCKIELTIEGNSFSQTKIVDIPINSTDLISFEIPAITSGKYSLKAKGISGIVLNEETSLLFDSTTSIVLILTDKAIYKPGDLIRFRVIFLNKHTKPLSSNIPIKIIIEDPNGHQIKQFKDIQSICGIFSEELQLATYPPIGTWNINVYVGEQLEKKSFEVKNWTLSKFKVEVDVPHIVCGKDEKVQVNVTANYFNGKPVKGEATAKLRLADEELEKCVKMAAIDGKVFFDFNIKDEMEYSKWQYYSIYEVSIIVKENLTNSEKIEKRSFYMIPNRYKINFREVPYWYRCNMPLLLKISVKDFQGNYVKGGLGPPAIIYLRPLDSERKQIGRKQFRHKIDINDQGFGEIEITIPENGVEMYRIYAKYVNDEEQIGTIFKEVDETSYKGTMNGSVYEEENGLEAESQEYETKLQEMDLAKHQQKVKQHFRIDIEENQLKLYRYVPIVVSTEYKIKHCFYHILTQGNIVQSGKAEFPTGEGGEVTIKFFTTFDMISSLSVLVFGINGEDIEIVYDQKDFSISKSLENFVHIQAPFETKKGSEIDIKIKSIPNSYVGLIAINQNSTLTENDSNITNKDIFDYLKKFNPNEHSNNFHGVNIMTNGEIGEKKAKVAKKCLKKRKAVKNNFQKDKIEFDTRIDANVKLKDSFSDVWIYDIVKTNDFGETTLHSVVPDKMTSWILSGFSINPLYGFSISTIPVNIQVSQPFFISTNLPYSVKKDEIVALEFGIFNHLGTNVKAKVTLDNKNRHFFFIDIDDDGNENPSTDLRRTKTISVENGVGSKVIFLICPIKIGFIPIKVKAISVLAGDSISDSLLVEAEGIMRSKNRTFMYKSEIQEDIILDTPSHVVPESMSVKISFGGDILAYAIENLGNLIEMPCGCGEQNMMNFAVTTLILKYLKGINKLTAEIESKARKILEFVYQNQLEYQHHDGSYSFFGKKDKSGSTWLTAYVIRSFLQASEFFPIDENLIKKSFNFLYKTQKDNGRIREIGHICSTIHGKGLSLTAFTLLTFMEIKDNFPDSQSRIEKGVEYIIKNLTLKTDTYSLAIIAYLFQKLNHVKKNDIVQRLIKQAKLTDEIAFWSAQIGFRGADENNYSLETTAYSTMAIFESEKQENILKYIQGLLTKHNGCGGFESTHDTVVALNALSQFFQKYCTGQNEIELNFIDDKGIKGEHFINANNILVIKSYELNPDAHRVSINVKGKGFCFVQVSSKYKIRDTEKQECFSLRYEVRNSSNLDLLELFVHASFIPTGKDTTSNMAVLEVSLPSGYVADCDNLNELETFFHVKRVETRNGNSIVTIYLDGLDNNEVLYVIRGIRIHPILKYKPSSIVLYDYYNSNREAYLFYNLPAVSLKDILQEVS